MAEGHRNRRLGEGSGPGGLGRSGTFEGPEHPGVHDVEEPILLVAGNTDDLIRGGAAGLALPLPEARLRRA
jgi:hypothetical protein